MNGQKLHDGAYVICEHDDVITYGCMKSRNEHHIIFYVSYTFNTVTCRYSGLMYGAHVTSKYIRPMDREEAMRFDNRISKM